MRAVLALLCVAALSASAAAANSNFRVVPATDCLTVAVPITWSGLSAKDRAPLDARNEAIEKMAGIDAIGRRFVFDSYANAAPWANIQMYETRPTPMTAAQWAQVSDRDVQAMVPGARNAADQLARQTGQTVIEYTAQKERIAGRPALVFEWKTSTPKGVLQRQEAQIIDGDRLIQLMQAYLINEEARARPVVQYMRSSLSFTCDRAGS